MPPVPILASPVGQQALNVPGTPIVINFGTIPQGAPSTPMPQRIQELTTPSSPPLSGDADIEDFVDRFGVKLGQSAVDAIHQYGLQVDDPFGDAEKVDWLQAGLLVGDFNRVRRFLKKYKDIKRVEHAA